MENQSIWTNKVLLFNTIVKRFKRYYLLLERNDIPKIILKNELFVLETMTLHYQKLTTQ